MQTEEQQDQAPPLPPATPADVLDEEPLTLKKGIDLVAEEGARLRNAGWKPFRDMMGSYVSRVVDAARGLADGFEGKSRRGD